MKKELSESQLEAVFRERVENCDGWCVKISPMSNSGLPDRLVFMPGGGVYLVEMKKTIKGVPTEPSPVQRSRHQKLKALGTPVWIIYDRDTMDKFFEYVLKLI